MTDARVANRYARALFNAALKADILPSVGDDLDLISGLIAYDERFRKFIKSPTTPREVKQALIDKVLSDRITAFTMGLLRLMFVKRREGLFEFVRQEFIRLRREHEGVLFAQVISARELSAVHQEAIVKKLSSATRKRVEAEFSVEPSLMGGVKILYENFVLDGTARGSLDRLRETLVVDLLKQGGFRR